jgi:hypothetical protein
MGAVTVAMPLEDFSKRKSWPLAELLFCTRPGGVVLILIGCCVFMAAVRRK